MLLNYVRRLSSKHVPRWAVLGFDLFVCLISFLFSYVVIFNLRLNDFHFDKMIYPLLLVLSFRLQGFLLTKSYSGIIKYTSSQDAIRIFLALGSSTFGIYLVSQVYFYYTNQVFLHTAVIVMDFLISLAGMTSIRLALKLISREIAFARMSSRWNIVVYGAGQTGVIAKRSLESDVNANHKVVAFLDENRKLDGKTVEGVPIYNFMERFETVINKYNPNELIIAIPSLPSYKKKKIIELGLKHGLNIKNVPPVESWINGELSFRQIKNVNIEDLLGREPISLDLGRVTQSLKDKKVLITGAAGSIGSEIARQCLKFNPGRLILLDQAETPLYELEYSLAKKDKLNLIIGDVTNEGRMRKIFKAFEPDYVFHAAAYKHVPMMEDNPYEAMCVNVYGTKVLADLAVEFKVEKFVFVSTDKAVNPTNIMGASKRMAEIYVQSLNERLSIENDDHCKFITTRFGNVLGSNGSVIPRFREQIENGGPVTVTHPEITRYFMTIPEACQLVLEAGAMGRGGEIFIFDMGEAVNIVDLARKMVRLSGFEVGRDIDIIFTGLRPGEKLKEELLSDMENTIGTHHPKIMIAKVRPNDYDEVNDLILRLCNDSSAVTNKLIVTAMKQLVPEYISNNSVYEELDDKAKQIRHSK